MMKSYEEAKKIYIKDHLVKPIKAPCVRLNSLSRIEETIKLYNPSLLKGDVIFRKFDKESFIEIYKKLKGKPLSGAEKSVIYGFYKFSV